jgi:hypothetical protein
MLTPGVAQGPVRRPPNADENVRQTYPQHVQHVATPWRALATGVSAEGVAYAQGRAILRPLHAGVMRQVDLLELGVLLDTSKLRQLCDSCRGHVPTLGLGLGVQESGCLWEDG